MTHRSHTRAVNVGGLIIGGGSPVSIQSMTNTDTRDTAATVKQIQALEAEGCELVRVAVPDMEAAEAVGEIKKHIKIPLAVDIHFDYRLALKSIENGADKLRINPGNIGGVDRIRMVSEKAKERGIPIRIGVNSGSLEADIVKKYNGVTVEGLVESALRHVAILESLDFNDIIVAIKASNVPFMIKCYEETAKKINYPLHVGVTEAGTVYSGCIKSSVGIGAVLASGIGDTIRVSLTGDPCEEIRCAKEILKSLGLRKFGAEFISCPTCGRTEIDLIHIASEVEKEIKKLNKDITVAVMGCVVNGPGEAKEADIGIAGGKGAGVIFKKGVKFKTVGEKDLIHELLAEIKNM